MLETRQSRAKQTGEVFTPPELVNDILNKLPPEAWVEGKTFIDPACGDGAFLVAVLTRKIQLGHKLLLETIFGVDLMEDNVLECRARLLKVMSCPTEEHIRTVCNNIVCHDALTYNFEFTPQEPN